MRSAHPYALLLCVLVLVGAVAGCGGDSGDSGREDESDEIRAKQAEFEEAIEADDNEAFCELIAPSFVEDNGGHEACLKLYDPKTNVFFTSDDTDMSVTNVDFEEGGESATVHLANKGFIYYVKEDGEWYPIPFTQ